MLEWGKPYMPTPYDRIPYPQLLKKQSQDRQFAKFFEAFKKLQINILFAKALDQMSSYTKFMKGLLTKKRKLKEDEKITLNEECSPIVQRKLPPKLKDLGTFTNT